MTRSLVAASQLVLALSCGAAAQPAVDDSGAWEACLKAPARACVLREAAATALADRNPHSSFETWTLGRIAEAQAKAGFSTDASATIDRTVQFAKSFADGRERHDAFKSIGIRSSP